MVPFSGSVHDGISLLLSTDDNNLRNQLAMDLSESGDLRVKCALISLIQRPELRNYRGTLVYALENYDCSDQALFLLELVRSGNFEVAAEAAIIIEEIKEFPPEQVKQIVVEVQEIASGESDGWKRDFALELLTRLK